ncbi:MAG: hypothetical protein ABR921_02915 [Candidatus Sulfotelmatobacter sp.]
MQLTSVRVGVLVLILTVVNAAACLAQSQSSKGADLDAELSVMLARDSACESKGTGAVADQTPAGAPALAQAAPTMQTLHNSTGRSVGIIATVENACHCSRGNCTTYVYVKSGQAYRLALKENLASLHPLKGFKQSMPALSGKLQVSDSEAETIIYEWSGGGYQAGICATVVQESSGHPVITKHPCAKP